MRRKEKQPMSVTVTAREKIVLYKALLIWNSRKVSKWAQNDCDIFRDVQNKLEPYLGKLKDLRMLDVGCGQRYPLTTLLHHTGNQITGIDLSHVKPGRAMLKDEGIERTLKTLMRKTFFDKNYYAELNKASGLKLRENGIDIRCANACELPFDDNTFEAIVSNATFEHIDDVEKAVSELYRVLKPGGVTYIRIHLFTALSGGHNPRVRMLDGTFSADVPPWDHLRQNTFPATVYLNQLRESDYRRVFDKHLKILEWVAASTEGEELLTPETEAELKDYSREELLKRGVIVIAQKGANE